MASDSPHPEAEQWLDGLAGRSGAGAAHVQGRQLRDALLTADTPALPPWEQIERRAAQRSQPADAVITPVERDLPPKMAEAANESRWHPWHALAASVILALTVLIAQQPAPEETGMRGLAGSAAATAVWRVAQPQQAAAGLAADLRALGAVVTLRPQGQELALDIEAPAAAVNAVNHRLAALESALDTQGRLHLRVLLP